MTMNQSPASKEELQTFLTHDDAPTNDRIQHRFISTFLIAIRFYIKPALANIFLLILFEIKLQTQMPSYIYIATSYLIICALNQYAVSTYGIILRLRARSAAEELFRAHSRPPILYLRSFEIDGKPTNKLSWSINKVLRWFFSFLNPFALVVSILTNRNTGTYEQKLIAAFVKYGPVLAIGRPGEKMPPVGAARFYVKDDRWQQVVVRLVEEAQLIILVTGTTEGLQWEIAHVLKAVSPEKILLIPHPTFVRAGTVEIEQEWCRFLTKFGHLFPQPLPERLRGSLAFEFHEGYVPVALPYLHSGSTNIFVFWKRSSTSRVFKEVLYSRGIMPLALSERLTFRAIQRQLSLIFAVTLGGTVSFLGTMAIFVVLIYFFVLFVLRPYIRLIMQVSS